MDMDNTKVRNFITKKLDRPNAVIFCNLEKQEMSALMKGWNTPRNIFDRPEILELYVPLDKYSAQDIFINFPKLIGKIPNTLDEKAKQIHCEPEKK